MIRHLLLLAVLMAGLAGTADEASPTPPPRKPRTISFSIVYTIKSGGQKGSLTLWSLVPRTIPGVQEVVSVDYSHKPEEIVEKGGDRAAEFEVPDLPDKCEVKIRVKMKIWPHDFQAAAKKRKRAKKKGQQSGAPTAEQLAPWLKAVPGIELEAPAVKSLVRRIRAKRDEQKVRQIHSLVLRKLQPKKFEGSYAGAAAAATSGRGDTIDYTDLFVALCRAKGVPARYVDGFTIPFYGGAEYAWPEVYLERYGWIYLDPLSADQNAATFEKIDNRFIKLSSYRGSPALDDEHYWRYAYAGESLTLESNVVVH